MDLFVFFCWHAPNKNSRGTTSAPYDEAEEQPLVTSRRFNDLKSFQDIPNGSEWPPFLRDRSMYNDPES